MTIAVAATGGGHGVIVAQVNLKFIWEAVSQIKVGRRGHAYVVDASGRLIADPDISLVLRNTDISRLPQVRAALASHAALDHPVHPPRTRPLRAHAPVLPPHDLVL